MKSTLPQSKYKEKAQRKWTKQSRTREIVTVWIRPLAYTFSFQRVSALFFFIFFFSFSFFFFFGSRTCWLFVREQCIRALFTDLQISFFNHLFIKNGSHDTIHTFKNYFTTVFSVFSFQFQQNKIYPNRPIEFLKKKPEGVDLVLSLASTTTA